MANNFDEMNVPQLLKYIEDQHGVKLPAKTTRPEAVAKLAELEGDQAPTAAGDADKAKKDGKLPKTVVLRVHEDNDPRNYIVVGYNGRNYQIMKDEPVKVPYGVYEILNNAIEEVFTTVRTDDGRRELKSRKKHRHPFSVEDKIYE